MKSFSMITVVAALLAGSAAQAYPPATAAAERPRDPATAYVKAVADFRGALASGDAQAAAALLADDATVFEQGYVEASKAEYVSAHLASDLLFAQATAFEISRQQSGESGGLAFVTTEGRMTGSFKGKAVDTISTETMVLRRDPQGWKIVHIHWSSRAATP